MQGASPSSQGEKPRTAREAVLTPLRTVGTRVSVRSAAARSAVACPAAAALVFVLVIAFNHARRATPMGSVKKMTTLNTIKKNVIQGRRTFREAVATLSAKSSSAASSIFKAGDCGGPH
jgi:hypothetical protein